MDAAAASAAELRAQGLKGLVDNLGEIDARAVNSIEIGGGITLRVGRYGPYLEDTEGKRANVPADVAPEVPWDEAMAALEVPALLLTGDRPGSARVGREGLEGAARNPRVTPVLVPEAGHQVRRSDPEAFYRAVDEWLTGLMPVG